MPEEEGPLQIRVSLGGEPECAVQVGGDAHALLGRGRAAELGEHDAELVVALGFAGLVAAALADVDGTPEAGRCLVQTVLPSTLTGPT